MGGRGSGSGYGAYTGLIGARMSPKEFKTQLSTEANFILKDLSPDVPKQLIIKKDFSRGKANITIDINTNASKILGLSEISGSVTYLEGKATAEKNLAEKQQKNAKTSYDADVAKARMMLWTGIQSELKKLRKKIG